MQIRKSLDKVVAIAGGCLVFATGGGAVAAGVAVAGGGASMLSAWLEGKAKHGPQSRRVLERIRKKVSTEFGVDRELSQDDLALLEGADYALGEVLLDCIPPPSRLAEAVGHPDGFAKAAAVMVIAEVATKDDLFAETGERANPLARRFAITAIEAALETALTNRDYFASLMPFALDEMSRDIGAIQDAQTQHGESLQRVEASVAALVAALEQTPTGKRAKITIGDSRPFVVLARRINQEVDDSDQALAELTAMVELVLQQQAEAERGTNLGDLVDAALRRIAEKALVGEFDSAAKEAEVAFSAWEKREAERRNESQQVGLKLIDANIEQNLIRGDTDAVATWVERRLRVEHSGEPLGAEALLAASEEWYDRGDNGGLNLDLEVSVSMARRALLLCTSQDQRGTALNWLGIALMARGGRDRGVSRLDEAIAAYRAALTEFGRDRAPQGWAMTQHNLGIALGTLGEREGGPSRLEEALLAHSAALEETKRDEMPLQWARIQNSIGTVLMELGQRETGTKRFEEALNSYRAALEERTRDKAPFEWASTQKNLGNVLLYLGQREGRPERYEEAARAFRAALREWTRENTPLLWATTQNSLAAALLRPDYPSLSRKRLDEAVVALRGALEEWTRERVPLDWAMAQANLGNALLVLGTLEQNLDKLEEAARAYRAALEEWTRDSVPLNWASATLSLATAIGQIVARTQDRRSLASALKLAQDAQSVAAETAHEPYQQWAARVIVNLEHINRDLAAK